MLLDPGPIPVIPPATSDPTKDPTTFTELVNSELGGLPALETQMDALVDPLAVIDDLPPDDQIGPVLDALDEVTQLQGTLSDGSTGDIADALQLAYAGIDQDDHAGAVEHIEEEQLHQGEQMVNVYDVTPAEAFQPVPQSLGAFDPDSPFPGSTTIGTTITNVTRPGATDFFPGEQYKIVVTVGPTPSGNSVIAGVEIVAYTWTDAGPNPSVDFGSTDGNGILCMEGIWGLDAVGNWGMTIYQTFPDGSILAGNTIAWVVSPLPAGATIAQTGLGVPRYTGFAPTQCQGNPPANSIVSVQLQNLSSPGSDTYNIGDAWHLSIQGEPLQIVQTSAYLNGDPLPWEQIGTTDENGDFELDGVMPDETYEGAWQTFYQVGSVRWQDSLEFTVLPPAA